jgi:putative membrane protein
MKRNFVDYFILLFKGMAMGAADVVPGVSGGTIAFISGVYEELIATLNSINLNSLKTLKLQGVSLHGKRLMVIFCLRCLEVYF